MQSLERTESGLGGFDTQWYGAGAAEYTNQDFTVPGTTPFADGNQGYGVSPNMNDPYAAGYSIPQSYPGGAGGFAPQHIQLDTGAGYGAPAYGSSPSGYSGGSVGVGYGAPAYGAPAYGSSPSGGYSGAPFGGVGDFNSYFNPELINSMASSPLAGIASSYAGNLLNQSRLESTLQRWLFNYKYYFNVNNFYVLNKIKLILFPLTHKSWSRRIVKQGEIEGYLPPREDINAPDLYIPLMAAITFTILHGFVMGTTNQFTPEVLSRTATTSFFSILFEVMLIKFGFYLLSSIAVPVSFLDLLAYTGYIFVSITLNAIVGIIFGRMPYYGCTIITSLFMAIFMVKTFRILLLDRSDTTYDQSGLSNMRNYFIFAIAILQPLISFFLGVVA